MTNIFFTSFYESMSSLVKKIDNVAVNNFSQISSFLKGKVRAPQKAKTFDFISVKTKEKATDILTFRDKKGDIFKRFIISDDGITTERTYIKLPQAQVLMASFLPVKGRKISSITKQDGEYIEKSEELQAVTNKENGEPVLHISKIETTPNFVSGVQNEIQSLYKYEKGEKPKGYMIYGYLRDWSGFTNESRQMSYIFDNFNEESQKRLKEDRYFPLHLYSFKQFKQTAPNVAKNPERDFSRSLYFNWVSDSMEDRLGYYNGSVFLNKRLINNRFEVINTSAHEREHAYQHQQVRNLELMRSNPEAAKLMEKVYTDHNEKFIDSIEDAEIYKKELYNYIDHTQREGYIKQLIETKARFAGANAEKEYTKSVLFLKDEFPYAPDYMIGFTDLEHAMR